MSDMSFVLFGFHPGRKNCFPIISYLILGAECPILVDTGIGDMAALTPFGMIGEELPEQNIVKLLKEEGLNPEDIGYIIHTHLDADHAGKTSLFPNARIVLQRKEIAFHATGYMPGASDLPWYINNMDRIEFIDGDIELFPGIKCILAIAHTGGHQHIEVKIDDGKAIMCGDTVFSFPMQLDLPGKIWPPGKCYDQALAQVEIHKLKIEMQRGGNDTSISCV